jgi:diguanylate cyclase (GGDEF)-like protein/PAS domain S-box-containing protein
MLTNQNQLKISGKKAMAERKRSEDALKVSETRYRRLFESAKDGILLLDAVTGQITDVNPFLIDLLGYSHKELLGKKLWEIGPFKDAIASQGAFQELRQKKYIRYDELPLETKRGEHVEVEFVSNVYDVDGEKVIQCNIRDNTERKRAKDHLHEVNQELSSKLAELQKHDREMKLINRMNDMLQACKSLEEAYQVISLTSGELFRGQSGGLAILHDSGQFLEVFARWEEESNLENVFALEDCWAMRRGHPHEVTDHQTNVICQHFVHPPKLGYICLPMVVQGETLGLYYLEMPAGLTPDQATSWKQLAVTVTEGIKISLSNLKLREIMHIQANHDPLTGLFNRRYLDDTLPRELNRSRRNNEPTCIAMLDIDHFKNFNDTFGHEAGDLILRELGHLLRSQIRKSDIACRYGGEEFVLVLIDSPQEDSRERLKMICDKVRELQINFQEKLLGTMTMSVGFVEAIEYVMTTDELLSAADYALYAAKQAGRDGVVSYHDLETTPELKPHPQSKK